LNGWQERLGGLSATELEGGLTVHVARTAGQRRRGLARLPGLPPDRALHILRCPAVHTFGMRFPLDLIWLDREGRVVRVDRSVGRRRNRMCLKARSVVEICAGHADDFIAAGIGDGYTWQR
jgi:uncharacterized membrane protein (UPF0127 family)